MRFAAATLLAVLATGKAEAQARLDAESLMQQAATATAAEPAGWNSFISVWLPDPDHYSWVEPEALAPTTDGGVLMTGRLSGTVGHTFLIKFDALGAAEWSRRVRPSLRPQVESSADGHVYLTGAVRDVWNWEPWIAKFDGDGTFLWSRKLRHPPVQPKPEVPAVAPAHVVEALAATPDGGVLVLSSVWLDEAFSRSEAALVRLSAAGVVEWQRAFRGANIRLHFMKPHRDGYLLAGQGEAGHLLLFKVGATGAVEWQRSYDFTPLKWSFSVDGLAVAPNDALAVAVTYGLPPRPHVLRMDPLGNVLWHRVYPRDYAAGRGVAFGDRALLLTWDGLHPEEHGIIRLDQTGAVTNRSVTTASLPRSSPDGGSVFVAGTLPDLGTPLMGLAKVSFTGAGCGVVQDAQLMSAPLPPATEAGYQISRARVTLRVFDPLPESFEPTVNTFCP